MCPHNHNKASCHAASMASPRLTISRRRAIRGGRYRYYFLAPVSVLLVWYLLLSVPNCVESHVTPAVNLQRKLLSVTPTIPATTTTTAPTTTSKSLMCKDEASGEFPKDVITCAQKKQGAILLHVFGLIYTFIALAIVCDEFFVPSLQVIIDKLHISEDVAGATFMAAGGSAPELATSFIGTFVAGSSVGIGTIVGSAVFNILFVIAMCTLFSKATLELTWWPLFRDVCFYIVALIILLITFHDEKIEWWESLILFLWYIVYVLFMAFNPKIEAQVKSICCVCMNSKVTASNEELVSDSLSSPCTPNEGGKRSPASGASDPELEKEELPTLPHKRHSICTPRASSFPIIRSGAGRYRRSMFNILIHSDANVPELNRTDSDVIDRNAAGPSKLPDSPEELAIKEEGKAASQRTTVTTVDSLSSLEKEEGCSRRRSSNVDLGENGTAYPAGGDLAHQHKLEEPIEEEEEGGAEDEDDQPLDLSWPDTCWKRITYIVCFPIIILLWLTLFDVRKPNRRNWFVWTFIGSILWIAAYSFLMTWWATMIGQVVGISDSIMGLTFLAAGTSVPDLLTSIIVAKKGFGDMAVSSSVGSNIFDVTIGLPVPWLLWSVIKVKPVDVSSQGMYCSILLLFGMLIAVIIGIALFKWRMTKGLGASMLVLYVVFLAISVLMNVQLVPCHL